MATAASTVVVSGQDAVFAASLRAAAEAAVIAEGRSAAEYRRAPPRSDIQQQMQWQKQLLQQQNTTPHKTMSKQTVQTLFNDEEDDDDDQPDMHRSGTAALPMAISESASVSISCANPERRVRTLSNLTETSAAATDAAAAVDNGVDTDAVCVPRQTPIISSAPKSKFKFAETDAEAGADAAPRTISDVSAAAASYKRRFVEDDKAAARESARQRARRVAADDDDDDDFTLTMPHPPPSPPHAHGDIIRAADAPLSVENKGHRLLKKLGWTEGRGLGRNETGMVEPIRARNEEKRSRGKSGSAAATTDDDRLYQRYQRHRSAEYQKRK